MKNARKALTICMQIREDLDVEKYLYSVYTRYSDQRFFTIVFNRVLVFLEW